MVKPFPYKEMVLPFEELRFSLRVSVPPKAVIGPAILVVAPKVIFAVLVDLPRVRPERVFAMLKLVIGKVKALAKLLLEGSITTFPVELIAIPPAANAILSAVKNTSLLELIIVPPWPIFILDGPEVKPLVNAAAT